MPVKKSASDDDEGDDDSDYHDDDHASSDDDEGEKTAVASVIADSATSSPRKATTSPKTRKPKKKKRPKIFDLDETVLPSHQRRTENGGYSHTNLSRSRISKANTGNTPWNKGKQRSSADRAKIAAGVRARNRAKLLPKLKRLKMSEDEYYDTQKEIKYLRERVRRAKLTNEKNKQALAQHKLDKALKSIDDSLLPPEDEPEEEPDDDQNEEIISTTNEATIIFEEVDQVFPRELEWKPQPIASLGSIPKCASGRGPGGLICCEDCTRQYSRFLSETNKDFETQQRRKLGHEIREIHSLIEESKRQLLQARNAAKKVVPPLPNGGDALQNV